MSSRGSLSSEQHDGLPDAGRRAAILCIRRVHAGNNVLAHWLPCECYGPHGRGTPFCDTTEWLLLTLPLASDLSALAAIKPTQMMRAIA